MLRDVQLYDTIGTTYAVTRRTKPRGPNGNRDLLGLDEAELGLRLLVA